MHRIVEAQARGAKMHAAENRGRLQFRGGWQDDRSSDSMIGQVGGVLRAVARRVAHIVAGRLYTHAHQGMRPLRSNADFFRDDLVVIYPMTLPLKRISGQWDPSPRGVGMHRRPIDVMA